MASPQGWRVQWWELLFGEAISKIITQTQQLKQWSLCDPCHLRLGRQEDPDKRFQDKQHGYASRYTETRFETVARLEAFIRQFETTDTFKQRKKDSENYYTFTTPGAFGCWAGHKMGL